MNFDKICGSNWLEECSPVYSKIENDKMNIDDNSKELNVCGQSFYSNDDISLSYRKNDDTATKLTHERLADSLSSCTFSDNTHAVCCCKEPHFPTINDVITTCSTCGCKRPDADDMECREIKDLCELSEVSVSSENHNLVLDLISTYWKGGIRSDESGSSEATSDEDIETEEEWL